MMSLMNLRLAALRISPAITRARISPSATRSLFVAAQNQPFSQLQARTFLTSATAESPAKKEHSSEIGEEKTKQSKPKPKKAAAKEPTSEPKKVAKKNEKPNRVPKPPPKAAGTFALWYSRFFVPQQLKDGRAQQPMSNVLKQAGSEWTHMSEAEKTRISEQVQPLKDEATRIRREYMSTISMSTLRAINKQRKAKGIVTRIHTHNHDKRPINGFVRFAKEWRAKNTGLDILDGTRAAAEAWKLKSEAEKKPYIDEYERELAEWRARNPKVETDSSV